MNQTRNTSEYSLLSCSYVGNCRIMNVNLVFFHPEKEYYYSYMVMQYAS